MQLAICSISLSIHMWKNIRGNVFFIVKIHDYAWLVPFLESEEEIFLKTIIPSRKATKKYLGR